MKSRHGFIRLTIAFTEYKLTATLHNGKQLSAVIAGAGNVAWHIGHAFLKAGIHFNQIYNRDESKGRSLANELGAVYISRLDDINCQADICILAVSDDAISHLIHTGVFMESKLVVHTAGTVPMDIFSGYARNYGVLYPLQTLTRGKEINFREVPLLIESQQRENLDLIRYMANFISDQVHAISSENRLILHLAGVICSNFTNRLYVLAEQLLREHQLPFEWMEPLIIETARKATSMPPDEAQTGPAHRGNMETINKHMSLLRDKPEILEVYSLLTESIRKNKYV
jgi:predicted short-subunit dehydrogenase-like oxidoreductase (DUF2520 family)